MVKFTRRKLKNGMNVLFEKREIPVVSVSISNRFGGAFENEKIKGIAHVIEHMVFTGTKTRTHEDISREIEKKGGILNAFTANEVTSFWFKLPSEHLFAGLDILTDVLNNPKFDNEKFEKEKKVILEEIKMYHDDPARNVFDKINEVLYEKPFGVGIIGTKESVSSLERNFVYDFYRKHYSSENFIVTIVGNADIDEVCSYLEKNFFSMNKKLPEIRVKKKNGESVEEREGIDQAHFVFAMHAPLMNEKEFAVLEVLNAYLAEGMSSKLFLKIREEKGLAYAVKGLIEAEKNYSHYCIYAGTTKKAIPQIKKIILEEFEKIKDMKEKELEEAKEQMIGLRKITSEESARVMQEILFSEIASRAEEYYENEEKIRKVTLEQVKKLAQSLIKKYSIVTIAPK